MKIIIPRAFDPSKITTNVPITETAWAAGTYPMGTRRYVLPSYDLYEVVVASTADEPTVGYARDVRTWERVGKINAFACFDNVIQNPTVGDLDMSLLPTGAPCDGLALMNVFGSSVRVTVTDPADGVVYDETIGLLDNSNLMDWPDYFFAPAIARPDFVLTNLPLYGTATIRLRMSGSVGEVISGRVSTLGRTLYGTSVGIIDRSKKEFDVFGGANIIERGYSKRANFSVRLATAQVAFVQNTLAARRALATVYIGTESAAETLIYGFYRDFTPTLSGPNVSECSIELEGLV